MRAITDGHGLPGIRRRGGPFGPPPRLFGPDGAYPG